MTKSKLRLVKTDNDPPGKVRVSLTLVAEILGDICSGVWLSEATVVKMLPNFEPAEITATLDHLVKMGMLQRHENGTVTTKAGLFGSEGPKS
jgi:hypothetical protein